MFLKINSLLAAALLAAAAAAAAKRSTSSVDLSMPMEMHALPGFDGPLPSRLFSGYIPIADNTRHMHYWFVESEGDPAKDPVILWMQGGPGASSAVGMFTELGPYSLSDESFANANSSVPTLKLNPYSWTKVGSLIFIESPCGVGFSYCDSGECPQYNDTTAADDNLEFVKGFFERFEEYRQNDFYIVGESYGGIYGPMLAERVSERPDLFNLKGIAVGNGCVGIGTEGGCGIDRVYLSLKTLYDHGQYSTETYESLMSNCETSLRDGTWRSGDPLCQSFVDKAIKETGSYYPYHIYDECSSSSSSSHPVNDYPCGQDRALKAWVRSTEVREAFHIKQDIIWRESDGWPGHYIKTRANVKTIYRKLIDDNKHYKILIYFGSADSVVPMTGGEHWVTSLGLKVQEPWRPWTLDWKTQVAGHIVRYEKGFDFVTIRGAGHMVPRYKARAALAMFSNWINNLSFPVNYPPMDVGELFSSSAASPKERMASVDAAARLKQLEVHVERLLSERIGEPVAESKAN